MKFRTTFRFQIGAIVSLVLAILLMAFISMHMVSTRYNQDVLADKQEKLRVISQGLSRGLAGFMEKGQSPAEIQQYFESQADSITNTNPRLIVGLYMPGMGGGRLYGKEDRSGSRELFWTRKDLNERNVFFGIKVLKVEKPQAVTDLGIGRPAPDFSQGRPGPDYRSGGPGPDGNSGPTGPPRLPGLTVARAEPITVDGQVKGSVLVAERLQGGLTFFRQVTRGIVLVGALTLLAGALSTLWVLTRLKRGVRQVTSGLARLEEDSSYRLAIPPSGELGEISAAINNMADAVEHKVLLEEQLEKASRLASLGQLTAGVAHEIRNPLGIMKSTVQVMKDEFADQDRIQEYLVVLNEQVDRQNRIIRELLDYAKPVPPIFIPVDVNNIVKSVLAFCGSYFQQHNITLTVDEAAGLPVINGDVEKLKQAFLNLIFNAVEAMPEGGPLRIATSVRNDMVVVEFADSGRGIPEADIGRLFDPFFTTKSAGTGLGLAMVHKIIEVHKGRIEVTSKTGEGTVFRIVLPAGGPKE